MPDLLANIVFGALVLFVVAVVIGFAAVIRYGDRGPR